ncbi:MAG: Wzz/FepE/Etk N-terminal domain-containing protein [Chloroflexota bacterium]
MELREYISIVTRNIWLIIPFTLLAMALTAFFSFNQPNIYESRSSFVARLDPNVAITGDTIYALDTLLGRQRLFVTYCGVMDSPSTVDEAQTLIGIPLGSLDFDNEWSVVCSPIPESNVLEIIVRGTIPSVVDRLNRAVGQVGSARADTLYAVFLLDNLDPVFTGPDPVAPNHITNIALGGMLGLVVSISVGFLISYLSGNEADLAALSIRDSQLAVYKNNYFQTRLQEEFQRAKNSYRTVSIAFIELMPTEDFDLIPEDAQSELMRRLALDMQDYQPPANIVAYRGNKVFEILIPERAGYRARVAMKNMIDELRSKVYRFESYTANFSLNAAVIESDGESLNPQLLQERGLEALRNIDAGTRNTVVFVSTVAGPFATGGDNDFGEPAPVPAPVRPRVGDPSTDDLSTREIPDFFAKNDSLDGDEDTQALESRERAGSSRQPTSSVFVSRSEVEKPRNPFGEIHRDNDEEDEDNDDA